MTVTVSDGALSASQSFTWTIQAANVAPVLTNPGSQTTTAGQSVGAAATGQRLEWPDVDVRRERAAIRAAAHNEHRTDRRHAHDRRHI